MIDFKLIKIVIFNFACYKGEQTLDFTTKDGNHIFLFNVRNGYGKTSLFHAIKWGFYGEKVEYFKDSNKVTNKDFINDRSSAGEVCSVEITFRYGDDIYVLKRNYNPKLKDISTSRLEKNGRILEEDIADEELSLIIPNNLADFFMFDGERLKDLFISQSEVHIRDNIHQLLGLKQLRVLRDDLKALNSQFTSELQTTQSSNKDVNEKKNDVKGIQTEIDTVNSKISINEHTIADNEEYVSKLRQKLDLYQDVPEQIEALKKVTADKARYEEKIKTLREQLQYSGDKVYLKFLEADLNKIVIDNNHTISELQEVSKISDNEGNVLSVLDSILEKSIPTCDVCGHSLTPAEKKKMQVRQSDIRETLNQYKENYTKIRSHQQENALMLSAIKKLGEEDYQKYIDDFGEALSKLSEATVKYDELDKETQKSNYADLGKLQGEISALNKQSQTLISANKLSAEKIRGWDEKKSQLMKEIQMLAIDDKRLSHLSSKISLTAGLIKQLEEALVEGVNTKRKDILAQSNKIFKEITNKPEEYSSIDFENSESFSFVINYTDGTVVNMNNISKGEKVVLAMSFLLGLNQFTGRNNVIVMDTPVASLDDVHSAGLGKALAKIKNQVIFLAQPQELQGDIYNNMKKTIAKEFFVQRDGFVSHVGEKN